MRRLDRTQIAKPECLDSYDPRSQGWEDLAPGDRRLIRDRLREMQLGLCVYCEAGMGSDSHVEHFRPRKAERFRTFEWENLFLSCQAADHCGRHKDRPGGPKYDPDDLIKPDEEDPDQLLFFSSTGEVHPRGAAPSREAARASTSIQILNLNHPSLRNARRREAKVYLSQHGGILSRLESFDAEFRKQYLEEEIKSLQGKPFASVVRHLLQFRF